MVKPEERSMPALGHLPTLVSARFLEDNRSHSAVQGMDAGDPYGDKSCHLRARTARPKLFHHLQAKHSMAGGQFEGLHTKPALGLADDIGQASVIEG